MNAHAKFVDVFAFHAVGDLDAEATRKALFQKQYFPYVKASGEELPAFPISVNRL